MTVLGIETATTICGAAVVRDGLLVAEAAVDERNVHAERIMGFVDEVIRKAGGLPALEGIAVSAGPGSFTGLRIGVSVAKGLAFATGLPVAAVPTLEGLAWRALQAGALGADERLLVVLGARRGEAFAQWFTRTGDTVRAEGSPVVSPLAVLAREAAAPGVIVTGQVELLHAAPGPELVLRSVPRAAAACSAATIAMRGRVMLLEGRATEVAALEPDYKLDFFLSAATT